jgi:hypothetical protein
MSSRSDEIVFRALDGFNIELPSWGFANTGTRFGKFVQAAAATSTDDKFADAGQVHKVTGCCPSVAVHVLWDFPQGTKSVGMVEAAAKKYGVKVGAINPNVFQDQIYKHGSFGNPDPEVRKAANRSSDGGYCGFWYFSTNSSIGVGARKTMTSRVSSGWRRKSPSATSLKPAASTSLRNAASSMR